MLLGKPTLTATTSLLSFLIVFCCSTNPSRALAEPSFLPRTISLNSNWQLQSSCVAWAKGEEISSLQYHTDQWIKASVPGTVLGSQVADGIFPAPYFGMNLRKVPGTDYPIGKVFGYLPMSTDSPYHCSWWYRTEFSAPVKVGTFSWLRFDGINYRANIWLNGKQVASSDEVAGAFRSYEFDISQRLSRKAKNVLAVEVFPQTEKDLGIDFLDWNPAPADKSMGLWRGVSLSVSGAVTVRNPEVTTHFLKDDLSAADLEVVADVANHSGVELKAVITAELLSQRIRQEVSLAPHEVRVVHLTADQFPQLHVSHPTIWWPYQYGDPHLEQLRISMSENYIESDSRTIRFGIREVQGALNQDGFLQFKVNRRNILIRGGGWTSDLLYREPRERLREELSYAKAMHLNAIRLEGKLGSDELFNLADEMGILVMAGWQCCDHWQKWDKWTDQDRQIAHDSLYSQITRLRVHPSLLAWMNGSDEAPPPAIEQDALNVIKERDWPDAVMSSAADRKSTLTGPSGVKMSGPYDYVPPEYWYLDKNKVGGAFGFNTETSPGVAIPVTESVQRTLPEASWWPIDEQWKYHAGLGKFAQFDHFNRAMNATYGRPATLDDYEKKAQLMAYDGERAMFEAYGANKYTSTGVIQWMLNNAWPSFIWHLYDYYLVPGGGYFGTRKANEPLHIQYRYDDRTVVVVNSTLQAHPKMQAIVTLLSLAGKTISHQQAEVSVDADCVATVFKIPAQENTTFLRLELSDANASMVSDNFYWIPSKLANLDWSKSTYVNTPAFSYADMRELSLLSSARVTATSRRTAKDGHALVQLRNESDSIAFFLHMRAVKAGTNEDITPIYWDDNYISLLPRESRTLEVHGLPDTPINIKMDGWNIESATLSTEAEAVSKSQPN